MIVRYNIIAGKESIAKDFGVLPVETQYLASHGPETVDETKRRKILRPYLIYHTHIKFHPKQAL